jgi:hypothetical protein
LKLSEPAFQNLLKFDEIIFNTIEIWLHYSTYYL